MPIGQPASARARAVAAPMPRAAPVTRAEPSGIAPPPLDHGRAPAKAGAYRRGQHDGSIRKPPLPLGEGERDGDRRRAGVAEPGNVVDHPPGIEPEPGAGGPPDPAVRLGG